CAATSCALVERVRKATTNRTTLIFGKNDPPSSHADLSKNLRNRHGTQHSVPLPESCVQKMSLRANCIERGPPVSNSEFRIPSDIISGELALVRGSLGSASLFVFGLHLL